MAGMQQRKETAASDCFLLVTMRVETTAQTQQPEAPNKLMLHKQIEEQMKELKWILSALFPLQLITTHQMLQC